MITLYARRHLLCRKTKYPDMVDIYSRGAKDEDELTLWGTIHIDTLDGLAQCDLLRRKDVEVKLRILDDNEMPAPGE